MFVEGEDELPPLDAGASSDSVYEDLPEIEPAGAPATAPVAENATPPEPAQDGAAPQKPESNPIFDAFGEDEPGESAPAPAKPEGVPDPDWNEFQAWKAQKAAAAQSAGTVPQPPVQEPQPDPLEITQEEFDAIFDKPEALTQVLSKATAGLGAQVRQQVVAQLANELKQDLQNLELGMTGRFEQMIRLNDIMRENPLVIQYPMAFKNAWDEAKKEGGDLDTQLTKAHARFQEEYAKYEAINKSKRIDVRGGQNAPKMPGSSNRGLHNTGRPPEDIRGLDFLNKIAR